MMRNIWRSIWLMAWCSILCVSIKAQIQIGTVSGIVTDPAGGRVVGAKIRLNNSITGYDETRIADACGRICRFKLDVDSFRPSPNVRWAYQDSVSLNCSEVEKPVDVARVAECLGGTDTPTPLACVSAPAPYAIGNRSKARLLCEVAADVHYEMRRCAREDADIP